MKKDSQKTQDIIIIKNKKKILGIAGFEYTIYIYAKLFLNEKGGLTISINLKMVNKVV